MNLLTQYWKEINKTNTALSAHHYLLLDLLRGNDPRNHSFTPISNKTKLENGSSRWDGFNYAKSKLVSILIHDGSKDRHQVVYKMLERANKTPLDVIEALKQLVSVHEAKGLDVIASSIEA